MFGFINTLGRNLAERTGAMEIVDRGFKWFADFVRESINEIRISRETGVGSSKVLEKAICGAIGASFCVAIYIGYNKYYAPAKKISAEPASNFELQKLTQEAQSRNGDLTECRVMAS